MAAVVPLNPLVAELAEQTLEARRSTWETATSDQRETALMRLALIRPVLDLEAQGWKKTGAAKFVAEQVDRGTAEPGYMRLARDAGAFSAQTLLRYRDLYVLAGHAVGLIPSYKGKQFKDEPWRPMLLQLIRRPPPRCVSTYHDKLVEMGFACTYKQVLWYFNKLPPSVTKYAAALVGPHFQRQNLKPHVIRDRLSVAPGRIWEGDGHQFHFYAAHPRTGTKHKFEMTRWLDIGAYFPLGYWISEGESALTTVQSLAYAMKKHDHVPDMIHVDPGPGFYNKMICDEVTGLADVVGFGVQFAIAGNAKGKGDVEGSFRWLEEKVGSDFDTFVGPKMPQEYCRAVEKRIARGEVRLPSLQEVMDAIDRYDARCAAKPRDQFGGLSSAEMWATRERNPLLVSVDHIMEGRHIAVASRHRVRLWNRVYEHPTLWDYQGERVAVHLDLHDLTAVRVRTLAGKLICEAPLKEKKPWLSDSRFDDLRVARLEGQHKRKQKAMEDQTAKASRLITSPAAMIDALDAADAGAHAPTLPTRGEALLAQGHSLVLPATASPPTAPTARPIDAAEFTRVREAMHERAPEESPEQRFTRWLALRDAQQTGSGIPAEHQQWFRTYPDSAEFQGLADVYESFGYLPGHSTQEA